MARQIQKQRAGGSHRDDYWPEDSAVQQRRAGGSALDDSTSRTLGTIDDALARHEATAANTSPASPSSLEDQEAKAAGGKGASRGVQHQNPTPEDLRNAEERRQKPQNGFYKPGGSDKNRTFWSKAKNSSPFAKIAGFLGVGGVVGIAVFFSTLLPLKVQHIIENIESKFFATALSAGEETAEHLFSRYIITAILPSIYKGECASTISPACRVVPAGSGIIATLYRGWSDKRLEHELATKHGIVIGREGVVGSKRFFITIGDARITGDEETYRRLLSGEMSVFDIPGVTQANKREVRKAVMDTTKWYRLWKRHKLSKLLERKYGVKRCLAFCKIRKEVNGTIAEKKLAAAAFFSQRLLPEKWGIVLVCVISGPVGTCDPENAANASAGEREKLTPVQKKIQEDLAAAALKFGSQTIADLVVKAQKISTEGFMRYAIREAAISVVSSLGGQALGEQAGRLTEKAVPVVGWILLGAEVVSQAAHIGPLLKVVTYANGTATAVATYATLSTLSAECKSGHCDSEVIGSFSIALATSLSGNLARSADFATHPLWQANFSGQGTPTIFALTPFGTAYANDATTGSGGYVCDDGQPVPAGQYECPEMNFAENGKTAAKIAGTVSDGIEAVPGLAPVADALKWIGDKPAEWLSDGLSLIPGYEESLEKAADWIAQRETTQKLVGWVQDKLVQSPDVDSGARIVAMAMAGADVAGNTACRIDQGCARISDQQAAEIQNRYMAGLVEDFNNQPALARIFNTDTPYSLASRLALAMPADLPTATHTMLAGIFTDPLRKIGSIMSAMFFSRPALAAPSVAIPDPYGVIQYGYLSGQIPKNPDIYWNNNCVTGPMGWYNESTDVLDVSKWVNEESDWDPDRGESVPRTPNPCLLIQSTVQSAGGLFTAELIPDEAENPDPAEYLQEHAARQ